MRRLERAWGTGFAIAIALAASAALPTAQGHQSPTTYAVASTVFDNDLGASPSPRQFQSDDLNVPGPGYAAYSPDGSGVVSQIDSSGFSDWNLDLRGSSRGFYLTVTTPNGGAVADLPTSAVFYSGRAISRCFNPGGGTTTYSWFSIAGANPNCAMRVNFTEGSTNYTLVMSPGYAGTGLAEAYCNTRSGNSCVDWTLMPNLNAANAGVANLYMVAKNGKEQFVAPCRLTFRIHVALLAP